MPKTAQTWELQRAINVHGETIVTYYASNPRAVTSPVALADRVFRLWPSFQLTFPRLMTLDFVAILSFLRATLLERPLK